VLSKSKVCLRSWISSESPRVAKLGIMKIYVRMTSSTEIRIKSGEAL
jgi:hypothetical protein